MRVSLGKTSRGLTVSLMVGTALGVVMAVMAVINGILLRPLPVTDPDQLFAIQVVSEPNRDLSGSIFADEFAGWTERNPVFSALASYQYERPTDILSPSGVDRLAILRVTTTLFDTLGTKPAMGRFFAPDEAVSGKDRVVVLSYSGWQRTFHGDQEVVGRQVQLSLLGETQTATVIGVAPKGLEFHEDPAINIDAFQPISVGRPGPEFGFRAMDRRYAIGRIRPGVSVRAAESTLAPIIIDVAKRAGVREERVGARLVPLHASLFGQNKRLAALFGAAAVFAFAVAFANSLGLVIALSSNRRRERAIRIALGAGSLDLARLVTAESVWLALGCSVIAFAVSRGVLVLITTLSPQGIRGLGDVHLGVLEIVGGFAIALSVAFAISYGPFVFSSAEQLANEIRVGPNSTMSKRQFFARRLLLGVQTAIVIVLLISSGAIAQSLWRLLSQPLGFQLDRVLIAELWPSAKHLTSESAALSFRENIRGRVGQIPGVASTAFALDAPLGVTSMQRGAVDGRVVMIRGERISDGYWQTLGVPLVAGRDFRPADQTFGHAVIVNESFANRWAVSSVNALSRTITLGSDIVPSEVVGVVRDIRQGPLDQEIRPMVFPILGSGEFAAARTFLIVQITRNDDQLTGQLRQALREIDGEMFVTVAPLKRRFDQQLASARVQTALLVGLAVFTLLLACAGTYAIVNQLAVDRRRELGIRSALGASAAAIARTLMGSLMAPIGLGIAIGLALTFPVVRLVERFSFRTDVHDARIWGIVVAGALISATISAWLPARRAARIPPIAALRQD